MMNPMRFLPAVVFLYLQFQPLVGAVMCMRAAEPACPNHEMASRDDSAGGVPYGRIITAPTETTTHDCAFAQVCAASALAVLQVPAHLDVAESFPERSRVRMGSLIPAEPLKPPLPPPIA